MKNTKTKPQRKKAYFQTERKYEDKMFACFKPSDELEKGKSYKPCCKNCTYGRPFFKSCNPDYSCVPFNYGVRCFYNPYRLYRNMPYGYLTSKYLVKTKKLIIRRRKK